MKKMQDQATFKFKVFSLYTEKNGKVTGPMSPVLFARGVAEQFEEDFNRLARVDIHDEKVFQYYEDGGLTGHDLLLIGKQGTKDMLLQLWVDAGSTGIPIAMCEQSDPECVITCAYRNCNFALNLTDEQIQSIFDYVFENPECIEVKQQL